MLEITVLPFKVAYVWLLRKWGLFFPWKEINNFQATWKAEIINNLRAQDESSCLKRRCMKLSRSSLWEMICRKQFSAKIGSLLKTAVPQNNFFSLRWKSLKDTSLFPYYQGIYFQYRCKLSSASCNCKKKLPQSKKA